MPSSSRDEYVYCVFMSGLSNYAPFLQDWKTFKDNTRKYMEGQPLWTNIFPGHRKGEVVGMAKIRRKADAESCYSTYSRHRGVLVHLFKISQSSPENRLLKCTCNPHFPSVPEHGHSVQLSGLDAAALNRFFSGMPASPQYVVPATPTYSYSAYPQQHSVYMTAPSYASHAPVQMAAPQMPMYTSYNGGMPVNLQDGGIFTEARGIFISNLSFKAGPNDLLALLSRVARPVDYKMHKDSRTGHFKGSATARFSSRQEALAVISQLNQTTHMGMVINVRPDTERTAVGQVQAPMIVNGSTYANYSL